MSKSARCVYIVVFSTILAGFGDGQAEYYNASSWAMSESLDMFEVEVFDVQERVRNLMDGENKESLRFMQVKYRIEFLKGSACDIFWEFTCPGYPEICISYYLVCDGERDCPDGEDEQDCASPLIPGSTWNSFFLFQRCRSSRKVTHLVMEVTKETTPYYFTSLRKYSIKYEMLYEEKSADVHLLPKNQEVTYYHSSKALLLTLEADEKWIIECNFETGLSDFCYGFAFVGGSDEPCAGVIFIRIDDILKLNISE